MLSRIVKSILPPLFLLGAGACSSAEESLDPNLYAPVDGEYDRAEIRRLLQEEEVITEITPPLRDFINEFYHSTGDHDQLERINVDIPEEHYRSGTNKGNWNLIVRAAKLPKFLVILFHELGHNLSWREETKATAVQYVRGHLLAGFDPEVGFHTVDVITNQLDSWNPNHFTLLPVFWDRTAMDGSMINALHHIERTPVDVLAAENDDILEHGSLDEAIARGLERESQTQSLLSLGGMTELQHGTFLPFLSRLRTERQDDEFKDDNCRDYFSALRRLLESGEAPHLGIMHNFMGCTSSNLSLYDLVIRAVKQADPEVTRGAAHISGAEDLLDVNQLYLDAMYAATEIEGRPVFYDDDNDTYRLSTLVNNDQFAGWVMKYDGPALTAEQRDRLDRNIEAAVVLGIRYLYEEEPAEDVFNAIARIPVWYPELASAQAPELPEAVFATFFEREWASFSHRKAASLFKHYVNTLLAEEESAVTDAGSVYARFIDLSDRFIELYGARDGCNPQEHPEYAVKALSYAFAVKALVAYSNQDFDRYTEFLTYYSGCNYPVEGSIARELARLQE